MTAESAPCYIHVDFCAHGGDPGPGGPEQLRRPHHPVRGWDPHRRCANIRRVGTAEVREVAVGHSKERSAHAELRRAESLAVFLCPPTQPVTARREREISGLLRDYVLRATTLPSGRLSG